MRRKSETDSTSQIYLRASADGRLSEYIFVCLKYIKIEMRNKQVKGARDVYEQAVNFLRRRRSGREVVSGFCQVREKSTKTRSRAYHLQVRFGTFVKKKQSKKLQGLYKVYTIHEKKYGVCLGIEDVICKKKHQHEQKVKENPSTYNTWFYYLVSKPNVFCKTYKEAIAKVLSTKKKQCWHSLLSFDQCRKLYVKFLELGPENCATVMQFAEVETRLNEIDCARAIYELSRPRTNRGLDRFWEPHGRGPICVPREFYTGLLLYSSKRAKKTGNTTPD
ncbi:crooked neck-like protein 1 [Pseudomyrmex gracilis]|uniref:crooked neck-like protein 1 n=1 Tax=Pseudomyrmex gracilis TaxID=219809 RepID=UPI000995B9D8|nr:crooked neck-like protein 1 [Pseudomyrmex gracilis]